MKILKQYNTKTSKLVIGGVGVLALVVCFFLETATANVLFLDGNYYECVYTFIGRLYCHIKGQKQEYSLKYLCDGDDQCEIVKYTSTFAGLSLGLGLITLIAYYAKEYIEQHLTLKCTKWGILIILLLAIVFQSLIPIFYIIDSQWLQAPLCTFPLVLEFLTLISYCMFWMLVCLEKVKKKEETQFI